MGEAFRADRRVTEAEFIRSCGVSDFGARVLREVIADFPPEMFELSSDSMPGDSPRRSVHSGEPGGDATPPPREADPPGGPSTKEAA